VDPADRLEEGVATDLELGAETTEEDPVEATECLRPLFFVCCPYDCPRVLASSRYLPAAEGCDPSSMNSLSEGFGVSSSEADSVPMVSALVGSDSPDPELQSLSSSADEPQSTLDMFEK